MQVIDQCILCGTPHPVVQEVLTRKALSRLYSRKYSIEVSSLIREDLTLVRCENCTLLYYTPLSPGDERFYNALQKLPWYYEDEKLEFTWAAKFIAPKACVLEVGAGSGAFASWLPGRDYTGLDISPAASRMASARGVTVHTASVEDWAKTNAGKYDVVCLFQVLEHVTNPRSFLESCAQALRPGGILIVSVPAEDSYLKWVCNDPMNVPPHHLSRWTDDALRSIGNIIGCSVEEIYHEPVAREHRETLVQAALTQHWIGKLPQIDLRLSIRLRKALIAWLVRLLRLRDLDPSFLGCGNAVGIVYKKRTTI